VPAPDVAALLGPAEGEAVVTVTGNEAQWHLEVAFVGPSGGVRQLEAVSCEDAARAALLFLKLGASAPAPLVPVKAVPPPPPPPPERAPLEARLDVGVVGNVGALPSVSGRIAATAGLGVGAVAGFASLRAGLREGYTTSERFSVYPALGLQLSGCFLPRLGRVRLGPCAAVSVEWWRSAALGVNSPRVGEEAWVAAGADARLLVELARGLFAFGVAGVRFSLRQPQLVFGSAGPVFTVPLVSGEGQLGLGWRW
jgi:hypothetical protein